MKLSSLAASWGLHLVGEEEEERGEGREERRAKRGINNEKITENIDAPVYTYMMRAEDEQTVENEVWIDTE